MRLKAQEHSLRKNVVKGQGAVKRQKGFMKYDELSKALFSFFVNVRDAHGAVSRGLLEAYAFNLPDGVKKDYFAVNRTSQDDFWKRWRTFHGIVYRRVGGLKQYVPTDFQTRIDVYKALLKSTNAETRFKTIFCADETGVRMEEMPGTTLERRGAAKVIVHLGGGF